MGHELRLTDSFHAGYMNSACHLWSICAWTDFRLVALLAELLQMSSLQGYLCNFSLTSVLTRQQIPSCTDTELFMCSFSGVGG